MSNQPGAADAVPIPRADAYEAQIVALNGRLVRIDVMAACSCVDTYEVRHGRLEFVERSCCASEACSAEWAPSLVAAYAELERNKL